MKKTIKLAVVAALALGATSAFATNGSNLIGIGAKARGMGGVGIGMSHGAESALANPALITSVKDTEVSFGGTIFMPDVENTNTVGPGTTTTSSAADMNVIPAVSIASKITDNFYAGIGMWGTAGMGVDYRDAVANNAQFNMVTNLQIMQFGVPLAYTTDGFSVAVTPVLQYGALDINYNGMGGAVGAGVDQDLKFGVNLGAAYEVDGLTIGATYKSQIDMEYKGQISGAMNGFGITGASDKLSTPEEYGVGVSYNMNEHTVAVDYKRINWSKAKGYEDFLWEDQDVYALGYEYATKDWAGRLGYNYAKSPISNVPFMSMGVAGSYNLPYAGLVNAFNHLGFPATVESHVTAGGTYHISEKTSVDLAVAYALEAEDTAQHFTGQDITTKHSQTSVSAQLNFAF